MSLPTRKIGNTDVSAIGYGAMGLSTFYPPFPSDEERLKFFDDLFASGCRFWDTSDFYGDNEDILGKWFQRSGKRSEVFLATKFGFVGDSVATMGLDCSPEYVPKALERSLKRLGTDYIDLWYMHRPDPTVPVELTVRAMAEAVKAGKVKYIGISECSANTLRRAHAVHPIAAVQFEYAPFTLDIEDPAIGIFQAAKELDITLVCFSPLGRGLLTGKFTSQSDFVDGDLRSGSLFPRFSEENLPKLLKLVERIGEIGKRHNATPGQVALAWILAQGDKIIPIPGTKRVKYLEENLGALNVKLTPEEVEEVRAATIEAGADKISRSAVGYEEMHFIDTPPLDA